MLNRPYFPTEKKVALYMGCSIIEPDFFQQGALVMGIELLLGASVILAAYGLTWYLLLKSTRIVKIIDREGLEHANEIKARFRRRVSHRRESSDPNKPSDSHKPSDQDRSSDQNGYQEKQ
jgi:hypothetical protein